jgi:hypothetical protein
MSEQTPASNRQSHPDNSPDSMCANEQKQMAIAPNAGCLCSGSDGAHRFIDKIAVCVALRKPVPVSYTATLTQKFILNIEPHN